MKKWIASLVIALLPAFALAAADPEQIVRGVSNDVLVILKQGDKDPAKVREQVDARVSPLADYTRMTSLAVGKYWRQATPEQQQALTREFRTMLVRTYMSALTIYKNAEVDVKGTRPGADADEQTVRTEVSIPGQKPIPLDFYFEKLGSNWKVFDIAVDGISFTVNNRNQFGAVIRKDGIDGLIKTLSDRNAKLAGGGKQGG
ncbi:MlaC/ttg2D family ABC transporter substrate-binding protein [Jeongeupia naejangsanensis]|uniref:ABC transporter substrate-binding protein n=1 Tax=Jeongeupia naejangsanensis TaxID=613195 RepID=A0ABS2BK04_9NEIS|nr:ABC transporter substrate-binding protein [Jeongeupia naejangsanensis]MBM3115947.1 ABC transporter substrate-binding protein [Jeongeupia naejangsanensis]